MASLTERLLLGSQTVLGADPLGAAVSWVFGGKALSPILFAKVAADEAACAVRRFRTASLSDAEWQRICGEVGAAARQFEAAGWMDQPALYHREPTRPRVHITRARSFGVDYEHLRFCSGYAPHAGEPGRGRWLGYRPCRTSHAWLLRRPGKRRPWLLCIHGYGMGMPAVDLGAFQAASLALALDVNVIIPVLPLHGLRRIGRASGDGFFAGDCLDTVHAEAQAIWDLRRLLRWMRAQGDGPIGVYGLSLGGYTAALLASLEDGLDCVIAGIPASDFPALARLHTPAANLADATRAGLEWDVVDRVLQVISPLAMAPRVAWERRYLFGGTDDRIVPPEQVNKLWEHWGQPQTIWYSGSHLSYWWERGVQSWLRERLQSHLCAARPEACAA